jgi:hypothetical protein
MRHHQARGTHRDSVAWFGALPLADFLHLSLLHPSAVTMWRRCGFEFAGRWLDSHSFHSILNS